jgi:hypothetical protein
VFPQGVTYADLTPKKIVDSGLQFVAPAVGYGGSTSAPCPWPGPEPNIFKDGLGGLVVGNLIWRNWGGPSVNYASTANCVGGSGRCIDLGVLGAWSMPQIGYQTPFPRSMFGGVSFYARTAGPAYDKLQVAWKYNGANPTATSGYIKLTGLSGTWKKFNLTFSSWQNFTTGNDLPVEMNVLQFQNGDNGNSPNLYLDEIVLWGGGSGYTPPLSSTTTGAGNTGSPAGTPAAGVSDAMAAAPTLLLSIVAACIVLGVSLTV